MITPLLTMLTPVLSDILTRQISDKDRAGQILHAITDGLSQRQDEMHSALAEMNKAQLQVNAFEAQSRSLWVAGWRPAIGWVCVAGLVWMILAEPVLRHILVISGQHIDLPVLRYDILFELTLGMLGMAGLRSFDKLKGTS